MAPSSEPPEGILSGIDDKTAVASVHECGVFVSVDASSASLAHSRVVADSKPDLEARALRDLNRSKIKARSSVQRCCGFTISRTEDDRRRGGDSSSSSLFPKCGFRSRQSIM